MARSNQIGLAYRERGASGFFDEVGTPTAEIGGGTCFFDVVKTRCDREGWAEASRLLHEAGEDDLVWPYFQNDDDASLSW